MEMVNGYVFLDLTKANVYSKALKVLGTDKPVVIKDGSGSPYFVDSLTLDGTNVVITKGGKTITIANDNTITNEGLVANPTMENIVDLDGNKRFIEGEITTSDVTGVTYDYARWSLSGSHLMIVIAGSIANGTALSFSTIANNIELPQYVKDKIIPLFTNIVNRIVVTLFADDSTTQSTAATLYKSSADNISVTLSSVTLTADRVFRVQFDLLIDNE